MLLFFYELTELVKAFKEREISQPRYNPPNLWFRLEPIKSIFSLKIFLSCAKCIHRRCYMKKGVLKNFWGLQLQGLRPTTLLKKRLWHRCFPGGFVKFLRTLFLQNTEYLRATASCCSTDLLNRTNMST